MKLKLNNHLKNNYEDYYKEGDSEWSQLGAMDKASNTSHSATNYHTGQFLRLEQGKAPS